MYNTIYRELAGHNRATAKMLAEHVGITYGSMLNKLGGKTEFTLSEMRKIQDFFGGTITLDELFADT